MMQRALALALCFVFPCTAFADFQYQQKTQITGGSALSAMRMAGALSKRSRGSGQPVVSSVYVKGNRMARVYSDRTEIIDLDRETFTRIDPQKQTYSVQTFQQMRNEMEKQRREAAKERRQQPAPAAADSNTDMKWDVKVRNTGANKQISGLETKESVLALTADTTDRKTGQQGHFAMTNDMWMAPEIPGYAEVRDFDKRFAEKFGYVFSGAESEQQMMAMYGASEKGMTSMAQEISKLKGVPVEQIMRMGTTADGSPLPAASEAPLPPPAEMPSAGEVAGDAATNAAQDSASNAITRKLGGLGGMMGGFGRKKKQESQPASADTQKAPNTGVLIETTPEMTNFSRASIGEAVFQVPAGYKQVDWKQQE